MARHRSRSASLLLVLALMAFAVASWCSSFTASRAAQPPSAFASGLIVARQVARSPNVAMQSEKVDAIVDSLKDLTLLEASELVKAIEETFGVDASASAGAVMMAAPAAGGDGEGGDAPAEKSEFDVVLTDVPKDKKIAVLKVVRNLLGLGLKEAKAMVDNPGKVLEGKPKDICEDAKTQLEEAGAKVELK
mmetsp:Transcript_15835/g.35258  ORF Transcript_15835/g.35258 Transcript_15835/m.35258 type:complete len:191 (-) Transcript_15835:85-657(-)